MAEMKFLIGFIIAGITAITGFFTTISSMKSQLETNALIMNNLNVELTALKLSKLEAVVVSPNVKESIVVLNSSWDGGYLTYFYSGIAPYLTIPNVVGLAVTVCAISFIGHNPIILASGSSFFNGLVSGTSMITSPLWGFLYGTGSQKIKDIDLLLPNGIQNTVINNVIGAPVPKVIATLDKVVSALADAETSALHLSQQVDSIATLLQKSQIIADPSKFLASIAGAVKVNSGPDTTVSNLMQHASNHAHARENGLSQEAIDAIAEFGPVAIQIIQDSIGKF